MMINFSFDKSKREKVVEEALGWFTGSNISIKAPVVDVVLSDGRITVDKSFYILCPFLGDLISPASSDSLIILQEFHCETFNNLQSVLVKGYIENCRNVQDVVDLAKAVNIDMGNIFIEVLKPSFEEISEDVDSTDYDDHRLMIVTDDEDSNEARTDKIVGGTIRLAEFSKLPFQIPNIMNTNDTILSFKCQFCDLAFSKQASLCAHRTSKHITIDIKERKWNTKENDRQYHHDGGKGIEENIMNTNRPSVVKFSGDQINNINGVESDEQLLSRRQFLLDSCKKSDYYKAYVNAVPKHHRAEKMPRTPDIYRKYPTKSQWNKTVNTWKKQVRSVVKELYLNKNENNVEKMI